MSLQTTDFREFQYPKAISTEIIEKWMNVAYRLFRNMLDTSVYSFFLSTPQIISQISFLIAVCPEHNTIGLRSEFGWNPTSGDLAHQIQHKNLMENTEKFMKKWNSDLRDVATPGTIQSARRALAYPTNAIPFHLNTLECLREYRVELKMFEGAKEHRHWVAHHLEANFDKQVVINVWEEETMDEEPEKPAGNRKKSPEEEEREKVAESDKKAPILMWIANANVAILPEIFDAKRLYSYRGTDYLRIVGTPKTKITVARGEQPWNMIILPTVNPRLNFLLIYDFAPGNLCPFDELRFCVEKNRPSAPCLIRQFGKVPLSDLTEKKQVFFPSWHEKDFYPNRFAEELQETVDLEEVFKKGGFGDLAWPNVTPSTGNQEMYTIGHLQHFSILTFFNTPSTRAPTAEEMPRNSSKIDIPMYSMNTNSADTEIVPYPFCAILWDSEQHAPVCMGKITGKTIDKTVQPVKRGVFRKIFGCNWIRKFS